MTDNSVLRLEGVTAGYVPDAPILRDLSMYVDPGELVAVVGPNGAGKSTVLKAVMNMVPSVAGAITLAGGEPLVGRKVHEIVSAGVSFVPQGTIVFPDMTVSENLDMAWLAGAPPAKVRTERREYVFELFPALRDRLNQRAGTMSGGERQTVALGRAMLTGPQVILLDEPSLGLSPKALGVVIAALKLLTATGVGVAIVEQNAAMALAHAHRGYVLDMGKVVHEGTGQDLLNSHDVRRLYIGGAAATKSDNEESK